MDEGVRKGREKETEVLTGLCPGPRRFSLGAEMVALRRKREGPVSEPSRISASGPVLGVLASIVLSPGQLAGSVSHCSDLQGNSGKSKILLPHLTGGALIGDRG